MAKSTAVIRTHTLHAQIGFLLTESNIIWKTCEGGGAPIWWTSQLIGVYRDCRISLSLAKSGMVRRGNDRTRAAEHL
jgi:hypothetical protein